MVSKLVRDGLWRGRAAFGIVAAVVPVIWIGVAKGFIPVSFSLMLTMAMAYALGAIGTIPVFGLRELKTLPVTNRDLWVASWVMACVAIPMGLALARYTAMAAVRFVDGSIAVSQETLFLASLYDAVYAGALLSVGPAMGYALNHATSSTSPRKSRWPWIVAAFIGVSAFLGGIAFPYFIAESLPLTFHQFTVASAITMLLSIAAAIGSLAWTPQRGGFVPAKVAGTASVSSSTPMARPGFADRLTGIPRIALPYVTLTLSLAVAGLTGFIVYWIAFDSATPLRTFLQNNALLLFETGFLPHPDVGRMWILLALVWITTSTPWRPVVRQLRILPLTTRQINTLLLITPFVQWASVGLTLVAVHLAVTGQFPGSLLPGLFAVISGISALSQALMIRLGVKGSTWLTMTMAALTPSIERLSSRVPAAMVDDVLVLAVLVTIGVAAFINHRTLTRSGSSAHVYRGDILPFGFQTPNARP